MSKDNAKKVNKDLLFEPKNLSTVLSEEKLSQAMKFSEGYKTFLDKGKTEREVVTTTIKMLKDAGFVEFDRTVKYKSGDKVYLNNRGKAVICAIIGKESLEKGVKILASHIDSPRLDLKPRPLYEEAQLAMFKTHYYGGVKKYQWTAIPLSLHGVILSKSGQKIEVVIGEDDADPVFCINDLLPHLAADQMKRTFSDGIKGEELNVLVGSLAFKDDKMSQKVKYNILTILNKKYGIIEEDLIRAELELVPAYKAKDVGLDRSFVGAYGQDDRVCAYTSLMATLECKKPNSTIVTILADKEETGSEGNTGLKAAYLRYFIADLAKPYNIEGRTVLSNSECLSADVTAAFDPTFPEVHEKNNATYVNYGVGIAKYTGARGKGGTSDASAEFLAKVCDIFDKNKVYWQIGELGKVDQGGGGTVAAYVANLDVDVIDVGVPVLSMHAPFEVTSKIDVFMTYKAFCAFANE